jgi:hypothetical protein
MPRFVIERNFGAISDEDMLAAAALSEELITSRFPEIVWEHSHVVIASDGTPMSYCVYVAPNEETVREHATLLGDHFVSEIYEIAGDVSPDDFPLTDDPTT